MCSSDLFNVDAEAGGSSSYSFLYQPSSGTSLDAISGMTTTILGNYRQDMQYVIAEMGNVKSVDFGGKPGGFNVLNVPDSLYVNPLQFWLQYNEPWLDAAVTRGDAVKMATEPGYGPNSPLFRTNASGQLELSGFGKEYLYLKQNGYSYDPGTGLMVKN